MTKTATPYAVLLTRTSPLIRTRGLAHIQNGLIDAGIPVLETELNERDAFKAIFSFQQTLDRLSAAEVPNLDKAKRMSTSSRVKFWRSWPANRAIGKKRAWKHLTWWVPHEPARQSFRQPHGAAGVHDEAEKGNACGRGRHRTHRRGE
jgi:hypothetical protein